MQNAALERSALTTHEKTIAGGLNFAAIFFPYVAPVLALLAVRDSTFVRFHAFRALIEQVVRTVIIGILVIASLSYSIYSMVQAGVFADGVDLSKIDWVTLLIKSALTWLALALWGVLNTISSVIDGLQALQGNMPKKLKWADRLAARWSGATL